MRKIVTWLILLLIFAFVGLTSLAIQASSTSLLLLTPTPSNTPSSFYYVPVVEHDSTATPTPTITGTPDSLPDLSLQYHVVTYEECPWGGPGSIAMHVRNDGGGFSQNFSVEINGQTDELSGLAAAGEVDAVVHFAAGPVGSINAQADSLNQVTESNESNNGYQIIFTPPPPCPTATFTATPTPTATASQADR